MDKNKKLSEKISEIEKELALITTKIGIKEAIVDNDEINVALNLSKEELSKSSISDLNYYSYKITNYCLYLTQQLNHINAIRIWVYSKLKEIISKDILNYKGVSWNYAEQLSINNNEWAVILNEKLVQIDMCISQYNDIVNILHNYAKKIDNMIYSHRKES